MNPPAAAAATPTAPPQNPKDCLACRLTGSAAFTGIGGYALYEARRQGAFAKVRPVGGSVVGAKIQAAIGVVFLGLGVGRLLV